MNSARELAFVRMNGLGNEIVVVDLRGSAVMLTPDDVRAVAAGPRSSFDQMMVLHDPRSPATRAFVRIYNTDGSESAACGNGTRCIAWLESRSTGDTHPVFETTSGLLQTQVTDIDHVSVDMGEPRFQWSDIPLAEPFQDTRAIELQIGPIDAPILHSPSVVNVGNPHCVFWVNHDPDAYDLARFGPLLENHPMFPERANISLAQVLTRQHIKVRTWERGAGLTRACGTAACATAVSAARKRLTDRTVTVTVPGGPLLIDWTPANRIVKCGPVELEYEDVLTLPGHAAAAV